MSEQEKGLEDARHEMRLLMRAMVRWSSALSEGDAAEADNWRLEAQLHFKTADALTRAAASLQQHVGHGGRAQRRMARSHRRIQCACSFCGIWKEQTDRTDWTERFLAGPNRVSICHRCLREAAEIVREGGITAGRDAHFRIPLNPDVRCRFCAQTAARTSMMLESGRGRIGADCIRIGQEAIAIGPTS